jgi:host factor-I protein
MPIDASPDKKPARKTPRASSAAAPGNKASRDATVQQVFLDELIRSHTRVSIFLVNGVKLEGEIRSYDRYVILMKNAVTDKVYKHAVSTIMPMSGHATATEGLAEKRATRVRRGAVTTSARG